jgi:hypothetical protein
VLPSTQPSGPLKPRQARSQTSPDGRQATVTRGCAAKHKVVAPSWPHGRSSRRYSRMARKWSSRRRYGWARTLGGRAVASLQDRVDRREAGRVVGLVHHVTGPVHGRAGRCDRVGARRSAQRFPCRLDGVACLRPRSRRGRGKAVGATDDLAASQPLRASREIRGSDRCSRLPGARRPGLRAGSSPH